MDEFVKLSIAVQGRTVQYFRRNIENYDGQDSNLFDEDYTIAGSTGFLTWDGSMALIRLINMNHGKVCSALVGKRILELGSGTGLLGLVLAAVGSSVLVTDLPQVVNGMIWPNIELNRNDGGDGQEAEKHSKMLASWPAAISVGSGSIACEALDWTVPIEEQELSLRMDPFQAEVILAAEAIWLIELVRPFIITAIRLMSGPHSAILYLSFIDRAKTESAVFASQETVIEGFKEKGCTVEEIHQDRKSSDDGTEHVYRVTLSKKT